MSGMTAQIWDSESYANNARFVAELGAPVLELLAPRPGERILDLGCGDGVLTRQIVDRGCRVVGVDSSAALVAAARMRGLEVVEVSAAAMDFDAEFDAVFSNAALHWMKDADAVIKRVARACKPQGRFVAEMGGHRCVHTIVAALEAELDRRGHDGPSANPWFFPTAEDYRARLTRHGFEVRSLALIPRPTPLPGDVMGWLTTFAASFAAVLPEAERQDYLECVRSRVRPTLCDARGNWTADYVRLRFDAHLTA
jgi:trans-aconitate methyltransferase